MKPIQKILVRIDPDLVAKPVLELTRQVALAFGARVELIQVFETSGYHGPEVLELADDQDSKLDHWRTARAMMGLLKDLAGSHIAVRGRMAFGVAEEEVSRFAVVFDHLRAEALSTTTSIDLIAGVAAELGRPDAEGGAG